MALFLGHSPIPWVTTTARIRGYFAAVVIVTTLFSGCLCDQSLDDIRRQEVPEGGNVTLTCYAQASKLNAYRWVYIRAGTKRPQVLSSGRRLVVGESRFSVATRTERDRVALKLTLSDVRPYESGLFMCWRQGQKPDPQVLLTVLEPGTAPEKQMVRQANGPSEVKYGDAATFFCVITPSWPVRVTWYKNGEIIPLADRLYTQSVEKTKDPVVDRQIQEEKLVATLTVTAIRRDSVFTCRIESTPPDQRDMPVKVLVPRVESLSTDPDKDLVEYGQPFAITCVVSGTDAEILWLKDGSQLSFGSDTPGREIYASAEDDNKFGSTVYIESMSFRDNGHYVCYIPGASKNLLINIEGRPARLLGVTGGDFFEDDALSLRCSIQYAKNLQPIHFKWQFEGLDLDESLYQTRLYHTEYNVTVNELVVTRTGPHNAGTYQCFTPYGKASITVSMFVPPSLGEPLPSEIRVREGDTLQISCNAVGSPPPAVTWERRMDDRWVTATEVDGVRRGRNGELRIPAASLGDSGDYRCVAQSEAGSFLADVVISVDHAGPEVYSIVAPQNVIVGDNFTVQCTVVNWDGEVDFTFHNASLSSLDSSRYQVDSYPLDEGKKHAYLTIQEATHRDAGSYGCNVGSYSSSSTVVEVHDPPAEIWDLSSSVAVIGRDFFISCVVVNGQPKVQFYFNGLPLTINDESRYGVQSASTSPEKRTHILKVPFARPEDSGTYECAADAFGRKALEVIVEEARDEVMSVDATPAIIGRDFNVTCTVKDWDTSVTFIHNNVVVDSEKDWRYEVQVSTSNISDHILLHTLVVSGASEYDEGTYECYTTPQTFRSTEVIVWPLAEVKLDLQARDRPNWRDSPIPIKCMVEGIDPDKVTILFSHFDEPQVSIQNSTKMATADHLVNIAISENEVGQEPSTIFTLGFYSLSSDLTGVWTCDVLLPSGQSLGKDTLFLEIEEPPEFMEEIPEEVHVDSDEDVMLNCSAKGSPDIIVAWYSVGIPEPIERRRQTATLFIPGFTAMDAGEYYCSASLLDREIRAKTKLTLRTPQPRIDSVTSTPAAEGTDMTVTCTVSHWSGQVLFLHNGEPVDAELNQRYVARRRINGRRGQDTVTHTLVIKNTTYRDSGNVKCYITAEVFGATNVTVISDRVPDTTPTPSPVTIAPGRVIELRGPDSVQVGRTLELTCIVSPVIHQAVVLVHDVFLIYAGGVIITDDRRISVTEDTGRDGSKIVHLTIREVKADDAGSYQCTTSTDPPAEDIKDIVIVGPDEGDCSIYTSCMDCVATPLPCRWCMGSHKCVQELDWECTDDTVIYGQDESLSQTRSGSSYCPVIVKESPEILVHNGESHSTYLDSKNIEDEEIFDGARFMCLFNIEGRDISIKARLWYSFIYCDKADFEYSSPDSLVKVPLKVIWNDSKVIDNPDDIHVTVYSCERMATTCNACQDLEEKYKCGWCSSSRTCEFEGRCPASKWLQPTDFCTDADSDFSIQGPSEVEVFAKSTEKVVLPCTASVYFDLQAGYWNRTHDITWTREFDGRVERLTENTFVDVSPHERQRYSLDTDAGRERGRITQYNLVIDPMQERDFGLYHCSLSDNRNVTVTKTVLVTQREKPHYDRCHLPDHWTGQWHSTADGDISIHGSRIADTNCVSYEENKYVHLNEGHECFKCLIIEEKHLNLLEYRQSPCLSESDMETLCSLLDTSVTVLKRRNSITQCPFPGRRIFSYQTAQRECEKLPSTIVSDKDNTEMVFWYQPCLGGEEDYYPSRVECVASWNDEKHFYLLGRLEQLPNRPARYRCYTYEEVEGEAHRYIMGETDGEMCGDIGVNSEKTYEVFDTAIVPGEPIIEGYGSVIQVTVGFSLQLECTSHGGVPLATLRWLRNDQEVASSRHQSDGKSVAVLEVDVRAIDEGATYTCEATNAATSTPLTTSTVLSFSKDGCTLPSEWVGRWYQVNNDRHVDITEKEFSNSPCTASLGQSYLLHDVRGDCNRCAIITEKHPNILHYKRSRCQPIDRLSDLCQTIGDESYMLVREDATTRCPWVGSRSFTFQKAFGGCSEEPSKMISHDNDTKLTLEYNQCPEGTNIQGDELRCIADWGEGENNYLVTEKIDKRAGNVYRCFTYRKEEDGRQVFRASRPEASRCTPLKSFWDRSRGYTYKIYGLSEEPSTIQIEGYSPSSPVVIGDFVEFKCLTHGGFPQPDIKWYRDGLLVESQLQRQRDNHVATYSFYAKASDKGIRFECQVSNYAANLTSDVVLNFDDEIPSKLLEPSEIHATAILSERVVLNCTALVSMDIEQYWDLPYNIRWMRFRGNEEISISDMHILEHTEARFSLDIENKAEQDKTQYNLIIDPFRATDEGIYECLMWDKSQSFRHRIHLTAGSSPEYTTCKFPDHWNGEWYGEYEDYEIQNANISGRICEKSLGNKYLLRNEHLDCNECFVIDQKHPNLLRVKESTCSGEEDLATLCSLIDYDWRWVMKKDAATTCPFVGAYPFTHHNAYGSCDTTFSKMYLGVNDTELIFEYSECPGEASSEVDVNPRKVECLATWSEGATHYLMGRWENVLYASQEQFRCYTYEEVENEEFAYNMSQSWSTACRPLGAESDKSYKVFQEAVAPGAPEITGYDPLEHLEIGDSIVLACTSRGGFPRPTVKWFRGDQELRQQLRRQKNLVRAEVKVALEDEDVEYRCEVTNMATADALVERVNVSPHRGIVKIIETVVMGVEGQNVFLPCARILDKELEVEWFDTDLDIKLTSGNITLENNNTIGYEADYTPYLRNDLFGLVINSGFLDTKYGCNVDGQRIGDTTLVIVADFLVVDSDSEVYDYFEKTEKRIETQQNSMTALNCSLKSDVNPVIVSWRKQPESQLLTQNGINLVEDEGYSLDAVDSRSYILNIPKAEAKHTGKYECQIILSDTEAYVNNFTLLVQDVLRGNLSSETRIPCLSTGEEEVHFVHNDKVLMPNSATSSKYMFESEVVADGEGQITTLVIKDTKLQDEGLYSCVNASDQSVVLSQTLLGFASEVMLNISNLRIVEGQDVTVVLAWDPPSGDPFATIETYEVLFFDRNHEEDAMTVQTENTTLLVPPLLEEETEYSFQVRVKTDMGWGAFSKSVFHKTGKYITEEPTTSTTTPAPVTEEPSTTPVSSTTEFYIQVQETFEVTKKTNVEEVTSTTIAPFPDPEVDVEEIVPFEEDFLEYYDYDDIFYDFDEEEDEKEEDKKEEQTIYQRVVLPCGNITNIMRITWNKGDELLFMNGLDLGGIQGLLQSDKGELVIGEGPEKDIRDDVKYTCFTMDLTTLDNIVVVMYHVTLDGVETNVKILNGDEEVVEEQEAAPSGEDDSPDIQFTLGKKVAVLTNTNRVGQKIVEVLETGGMTARLLDTSKCDVTDVRGWPTAEKTILECEARVLNDGDLQDDEIIFVGLDFFVEMLQSRWFAVTQLYLHNVEKDISVNVFGPMVPVPAANIISSSDPSGPIIKVTDEWWNTVQGVDKSSGSGLTASILSLQESYLTLLEAKTS